MGLIDNIYFWTLEYSWIISSIKHSRVLMGKWMQKQLDFDVKTKMTA